tara:strand:- start:548 stop:988 length:441 start_codon:yes stop_codon:yes gene_type:complete
MKIFPFFLLGIFPTVLGIVPTNLYNFNHMIYKQYNVFGNFKHLFEPNVFSLIEHTKEHEKSTSNIREHVGNSIVKSISSILPHVDNIGHTILHANNVFINDILNSPVLDHETQKSIILFSIKMAQYGDDMGSHLLQTYYNIVDYSL